MGEFISEKSVKVRKRHVCFGCNKFITIGQTALRWTGAEDGVYSLYYHAECREAELAINTPAHGRYWHDEWCPLHEAEREEYRWLKRNHPVAYRSMLMTREQHAAGAAILKLDDSRRAK